MRLLGNAPRRGWLPVAAILTLVLAAMPAVSFGGEEVKVSMEDILKEISHMRREIRELKIQRDRDQRTIEDLRRIVEYGVPNNMLPIPEPAAAKPLPMFGASAAATARPGVAAAR